MTQIVEPNALQTGLLTNRLPEVLYVPQRVAVLSGEQPRDRIKLVPRPALILQVSFRLHFR